MWSLCIVVHDTIMNLTVMYFAVKINLSHPLKVITSQDVSNASTVNTAASSFGDEIKDVFVLCCLSVFNI